jgi:hypothetical protein
MGAIIYGEGKGFGILPRPGAGWNWLKLFCDGIFWQTTLGEGNSKQYG